MAYVEDSGRRRRLVAVALGWGLVALLVALFAGGASRGPAASVDKAFPDSTPQDWVTYGDHLVQLRVARPEPVPPGQPATTKDGHSAHGEVTIRVEETLWSRTGVPADDAPATLAWRAGNWSPPRKQSEPFAFDSRATLLPGHRYLALITLIGRGDSAGDWVALDLLWFDTGVVGDGQSRVPSDSAEPLMRDQIWGMTGQQVVAVLQKTPPDPLAQPYLGEDPATRYQHVARDSHPGQTASWDRGPD